MILSGRYNPQFTQMFSMAHTLEAVELVCCPTLMVSGRPLWAGPLNHVVGRLYATSSCVE